MSPTDVTHYGIMTRIKTTSDDAKWDWFTVQNIVFNTTSRAVALAQMRKLRELFVNEEFNVLKFDAE